MELFFTGSYKMNLCTPITVLSSEFSGSIIYFMIYYNFLKHFFLDYYLSCIKNYMLGFEYLIPNLFT